MDNDKILLEKVLSNSVKTQEEDEFKAYLMLDNDFDLDADREDNNNLPKVIVWPKSIPLNGDINDKGEEITKKLISFTQSVGQQINPKIYIVEDDFPDYVNWLKTNETYKNFIISINSSDLLKRANSKYKTSEQSNPETAPIVIENVNSNINQKTIAEPAPDNAVSNIPPTEKISQPTIKQENQGPTLTLKPNNKPNGLARAGFVKFPIFILTLIAIGAFGIFVGKMVYMFLSR